MAIAATAIRTAIVELLDGEIGTIRTVAVGAMEPGHYPWHGNLIESTTFDVSLPSGSPNLATPVSGIANYRLEDRVVEITVYHKLGANIDEDARGTVRDLVTADIDACKQALHYRQNLIETDAGATTGIISGIIDLLTDDNIEEDWEEDPPRIITQIIGTAVVRINQPVTGEG